MVSRRRQERGREGDRRGGDFKENCVARKGMKVPGRGVGGGRKL